VIVSISSHHDGDMVSQNGQEIVQFPRPKIASSQNAVKPVGANTLQLQAVNVSSRYSTSEANIPTPTQKTDGELTKDDTEICASACTRSHPLHNT